MENLLSCVLLLVGGWQVKEVASLSTGGPMWLVCGDTDHNGAKEVIFYNAIPTYPNNLYWHIWEHTGWNRYRIAHADTGPNQYWPPGPGVYSGNFCPSDIGDPDQDGLTDILGYNIEYCGDSAPYLRRPLIVTMESPAPESLPTRMSWSRRYMDSLGAYQCDCRQLAGDLDRDGHEEIMYMDDGVWILECTADNEYAPICFNDSSFPRYGWAVGDFDMDSSKDFAGTSGTAWVSVVENHGPSQYRRVWFENCGHPNTYDVFSGRDVNQNGRPEFFVRSAWYQGLGWGLRLFMYEATADNAYQRHTIAETSERLSDVNSHSDCGDVDGDGVEEVVWATTGHILVLKPTSEFTFEVVHSWYNSLPQPYTTNARVLDMNSNGYGDIVVSGDRRTTFLEVEAIRVLAPNRRQDFYPGDTCRISWQTFEPPRCDSVSLFLRRDSTFRLDTIATGLASADTPFVWIVPDVWAESARIMAIAYGPGWQYDESDTAFRVLGTPGIEEVSVPVVRELRLDIQPNPCRQRAMVSYDVPCTGPVELAVFDASGRRTALLASGAHDAGRYQARWSNAPAGIYYVLLKAEGRTVSRKVVVQ